MASDRVWGNRKEGIVILDANALVMLFEFSIDLHGELQRLMGLYRCVVPQSVLDELVGLSEQGQGRQQRFAKAAVQLAKKYERVDVDVRKTGDDAIVDLAVRLQGVVLTNDRVLRKRLRVQGISSIFLRNKSYLVLE